MLEKYPKGSEMLPDVAVARSIIDDAFDIERTGRSRVIVAVYEAVKRVERQIDAAVLRLRPRQWTERRVRSIVDSEAVRIDHYEIEDLRRVQLQEARNELKRSRAREARLAALLSATDPDFFGPEIDRMGERLGRLGSPGDRG